MQIAFLFLCIGFASYLRENGDFFSRLINVTLAPKSANIYPTYKVGANPSNSITLIFYKGYYYEYLYQIVNNLLICLDIKDDIAYFYNIMLISIKKKYLISNLYKKKFNLNVFKCVFVL